MPRAWVNPHLLAHHPFIDGAFVTRAFVVTVFAFLLSACGSTRPLEPLEQPASSYAPYFGSWGGMATGATARRNLVSTGLGMSLSQDGDTAVISVSCGAGAFDVYSYHQGSKSVYFSASSAACLAETPCGNHLAKVGGIVLFPVPDDRVAFQLSLEITDCDAGRSEIVSMSGLMLRSP